jgi:mono/diheme cytochrome c family protein
MEAHVVVESAAAYRQWLASQGQPQLGASEWRGVCAKCHGLTGAGGYGPRITGSPILTDRQGFETIVRNGRDQPNFPGVMPPVADGWSKQQLDALFTYVGSKIVGGGGGG